MRHEHHVVVLRVDRRGELPSTYLQKFAIADETECGSLGSVELKRHTGSSTGLRRRISPGGFGGGFLCLTIISSSPTLVS